MDVTTASLDDPDQIAGLGDGPDGGQVVRGHAGLCVRVVQTVSEQDDGLRLRRFDLGAEPGQRRTRVVRGQELAPRGAKPSAGLFVATGLPLCFSAKVRTSASTGPGVLP